MIRSTLLPLTLSLFAGSLAAQPDRADVRAALDKAVRFYSQDVSTGGGYHFLYASDLSYGRSEQAEGATQVSVQREGTPRVGMAYLEAWRATGEARYLDAARETARALVRGQHWTGGWDYIIEFDPAKRRDYPYRADGSSREEYPQRRYTTFDDNVSQAALRLLMRVDRALDFHDEPIHEAAEYALARIAEEQYPNGAWPQRFFRAKAFDPADHQPKRASLPDSWSRTWPAEDYRDRYTLNDNTLADLIDVYLEAARIYDQPSYRATAMRGGDFLLRAQLPEPQPGWAQQYDAEMHPAWARVFEPPSITGGEVRSVLRILLTLYGETGEKRFLAPIPRALQYYRTLLLPPDRDPPERRRRTCPGETPCLARFNELHTDRPLFITKGTMVRVPGRAVFRDDGYEVSYSDDSIIQHYALFVSGSWIDEIAAEYERVSAGPAEPRVTDLSGLSPWADASPPERPSDARVEAILSAMDDRGAWLEDGTIGKADRVVSVNAAEPMVVVIGEKSYPLAEDETVSVYRGSVPPREKVLRSTTFAENVEALAVWLGR